jgi:UDP-N-acetylglucosamine 2-epimerase (non-hydrolysing)
VTVTHSALVIFGTRPEAIKLCPLVRHMRQSGAFDVRVCVTGQHREMLDQVLQVFDIRPDHDLAVMRSGQTLPQVTSRILAALESVLASDRPDVVLVQGDTTTTLCGALAAFYARIPVGHVEAGLRTWDMAQPFPEEMNRVVVGKLTSLHFAATRWAEQNLLAEGIAADTITTTGNTGIDAVMQVANLLATGQISSNLESHRLDPRQKLLVVTMHRRENFGEPVTRICEALRRLAARGDIQIVYPVHPNPNVAQVVRDQLNGIANLVLLPPMDYVSFVDLMQRAWLLLTDSGGVQEEGPSLGKPVIVLRDKTERPEAVDAGTVTLAGSDIARILQSVNELLTDTAEYERRRRIHNPYGDGHASERITARLTEYCQARLVR